MVGCDFQPDSCIQNIGLCFFRVRILCSEILDFSAFLGILVHFKSMKYPNKLDMSYKDL